MSALSWAEIGLSAAKAGVVGVIAGVAAFAAILAVALCVRAYRAADADSGIGGFAWQGLLLAFVLGLLGAAAFGVGKALELVTDGWGAIVGIVTAFFGGWLAYKGAVKISAKGSTVDTGTQP
ncbi:MAG: hypothetical protein A2Y38_13315 [Spirochaetes bacterium GWB1_59_5]|nr:MAG: hypothetical protein A2Y38_13315 [Spirochaetes bacterium GWB1_59_5]